MIAVGVGHLALIHHLPAPAASVRAARYCSRPDSLMVPVTTGHFFASAACFCKREREQRDDEAERAEGDHQRRHLGSARSRAMNWLRFVQPDRRAEHDCERDRRADAEAAPQALRQIALQHRFLRMQRIVIDRDDGADRIFRDGLGDLEIAEVFADADAVVAQFLAGDGIFVDDIGEIALLDCGSRLRGRCR